MNPRPTHPENHPFPPRFRAGAITLFDAVLVTGLIMLLGILAVPGYQRASHRSDAHELRRELAMIHRAANRAALDRGISRGNPVAFDQLANFLTPGNGSTQEDLPKRLLEGNDPLGNPYPAPLADQPPNLSRASHDLLLSVVPPSFWEPYGVATPNGNSEPD